MSQYTSTAYFSGVACVRAGGNEPAVQLNERLVDVWWSLAAIIKLTGI